MTQPCNSNTDASSKPIACINTGATFTTTALVLNIKGNHWYKVSLSGNTGYVPASKMSWVETYTSDVDITGETNPPNMTYGTGYHKDGYPIQGTVFSKYNDLVKIEVEVTDSSGKFWTGDDDTLNGKSYPLNDSNIDSNTKFGSLAVGSYTYTVRAKWRNYHATDIKTATYTEGWKKVQVSSFTVSAATHTHSWSKKSDSSYHWEACSCGATQNKASHSWSNKTDSSYHWQACSCGATRNKATHTWSKKYDSSYHWDACSCGATRNKTSHSWSRYYDRSYHGEDCSCGATRNKVSHSWSKKYDSSYHWDACSCGATLNKTSHSLNWQYTDTPSCTVGGSKRGTCSGCQYSTTATAAKLGHNYENGICTRCRRAGTCGSGVYWTYSSTKLEITGSGWMSGYANSSAPWAIYADSITSVTVGDGVLCVGNSAFRNHTALTSISLADSVQYIYNGAFLGCSALTDVNLPDTLIIIDPQAFQGCSALKNITLPDSLTSIGWQAFCNCTALKEITIPDNVTYIGVNAFSGCSGLVAATIGDSVETIEKGAFRKCTSLKEITIPASVTSIGDSAFNNCHNLATVNIGDGVTSIDAHAFLGCYNLATVNMGDSVKSIGYCAFSYCGNKLKSITIPGSVTDIDDYAFSYCGSLEKVAFSGKAPSFGVGCFEGNTSTAYYPCNDNTWTSDKRQDYGGDITWKAGHSEKTVSGKPATCTATGLTDGKKCTVCGTVTVKQQTIPAGHKETTVTGKPATCIATGLTDGKKCSVCGTVTVKQQVIDKKAHKETTVTGKAATCTATGLTDGKKCSVCGTVTVKQQTIVKLAHSYKNGVCTKCSAKDPNYVPPVAGVDRVYGSSRYDTAFQSADTLKKQMGVEKFSCAIVTSGDNFADALAGSYLAYVKNAPILLTDNDNIGDVMAYIQKNVASGATVYALGGKAVVTDKLLDLEKKGYDVKRLAGKSRFETNLEILKECGSVAGKDILVCTGFNFADSLSASAAKRPILLVDDKLTDGQKAYLKQQSGCKYCIVGGTGAVTSSVEKSLKSYGSVSRLAGSNRFETSVMVAKKFFSDPTTAVLAYGYNFPDGLCAGPLAATINAPLILTATGDEAQAAAYAKEEGIKDGYVLGGSALINDKAVKKIFSMGSGDKIQ